LRNWKNEFVENAV